MGYSRPWQAREVRGARGAPGPTGHPLSAPVKLVVWDLDDTFWHGTLSEGPVTIDPPGPSWSAPSTAGAS